MRGDFVSSTADTRPETLRTAWTHSKTLVPRLLGTHSEFNNISKLCLHKSVITSIFPINNSDPAHDKPAQPHNPLLSRVLKLYFTVILRGDNCGK